MLRRIVRSAATSLLFSACFLVAVLLLGPAAHAPTRDALLETVSAYYGRPLHLKHGHRLRPLHRPTPEEEWEYRRALVYEGTGARVRRFLRKAQSGQAWTMAVIGGSVSKGRGLVPPAGRWTRPSALQEEGDEAGEEAGEEAAGEMDSQGGADDLLGAYTLYSPENLHVQVFQWLNSTFPHPDNRMVNGAQGGVGAGYFGWCYREHIPEESDLVLVELGIQDLVRLDVFGKYEQLIRGLLEMPSRPAVINIETFSTLFPTLLSASTLHHDTNIFYDIPSLSIRDALLPRILASPDEELPKWFRTGDDVALGDNKVKEYGGQAVDLMHISALGHAFIAGLVIRYLSENLWPPANGEVEDLSAVPSVALTSSYHPDIQISRHSPECRSMNSARKHTPVSGTGEPLLPTRRGLVLGPKSKGWAMWSWQEKSYLVATEPGSLAQFDLIVSPPHPVIDPVKEPWDEPVEIVESTEQAGDLEIEEEDEVRLRKRQYHIPQDLEPRGRILLGYQASAVLGFGSVFCWIDDARENGTLIDGWWEVRERNMGVVREVASNIEPGHHSLNCELLEHTLDPDGGTEFRIFAYMHD